MRQRERSDRSRRAVEQHPAATLGTLRQKNIIVLEVGSDAQDLSALVHSSLQPLAVSHLTSPLPFQELRRRLKFRVFETLDDAESYVSEVLKEFLTNAEQVKSLTLYPYIKHAQSNWN